MERAWAKETLHGHENFSGVREFLSVIVLGNYGWWNSNMIHVVKGLIIFLKLTEP
jgi:hypothetical protein